jgi:predicted molibdopterin-dependent oxidoreductase YjgC
MLRMNGKLEEASWEETLRSMAQRLEEIKVQYGPQSIGAIVSSRLTNEEYFLFKKLFKEAIGSKQIILDGSRSAQELSDGLSKTLGSASSTNSIKEIREADSILIIGADPALTHPIIKNEIHLAIRKNKAQLIVLGNSDIELSRNTKMSPLSPPSITLLTRPGEEIAVLNGIIGIILREGIEDKGFLNERTEGIEALRQRQGEYLERLTLFPKEMAAEVERAAKKFAQAKNGMILIGPGHWPCTHSKEIAMASSNLALLTGHIGKKSSGILLLLKKCNSQGAIDMGMGSVAGTIENLLKKAEEGSIKALYLIGKDLCLSSGALKNLELLVVQDLFMTGAAKEAHVLLPVCSFIEKSGTYTNLERRIQNLHPLHLSSGQSRSDFDILIELLHLLEVPLQGTTPGAILNEISKTVPQYQGLQDGEQWPRGANYLYGDGFPIRKARLIPLATHPSQPQPDPYPFCIVENTSLFESGCLSLKSENLTKVLQKPSLEINVGDAQSLKIENGETVQISTQERGSLKIKVKVSSKIAPSVLATSSPCSLTEDGVCWAKVERLKGS